MKIFEMAFNLALILVGGAFCISSVYLGLGKVNDPGAGLIPLGTGALLILFSLAAIVESAWGKDEEKQHLFENRRWQLVVGVLISMFVYAEVLHILGFLPATFLLLGGLFKVSGVRSWKGVLAASSATTVCAYLLFDTFFNCNLPSGFLKF